MDQLFMYARIKKPVKAELPEGYTVRTLSGTDEDIDKWVDVCKDGLIGENGTRANYESSMLGARNFHPEDVFMVEKDGEPAATICALLYYPEKIGNVHMVCANPKHRGKGLGNYIIWLALDKFYKNGMIGATLSTDDFRIPAVKSYLTAGFLPVLYAEGMEERWAKLLKLFGITEIEGVDKEGNFVKYIKADE